MLDYYMDGFTHSLILTPTLAALGWIVSDSAIFGNSLLVRKLALPKADISALLTGLEQKNSER